MAARMTAIAAVPALLLALAGCDARRPVAETDRAAFLAAFGAAGADLSALKACRDSRAITIDSAREVEIREARFSHLLHAAREVGLGKEARRIENTPGKGPVNCAAGFERRLDGYDRRALETLQIIDKLEKAAA